MSNTFPKIIMPRILSHKAVYQKVTVRSSPYERNGKYSGSATYSFSRSAYQCVTMAADIRLPAVSTVYPGNLRSDDQVFQAFNNIVGWVMDVNHQTAQLTFRLREHNVYIAPTRLRKVQLLLPTNDIIFTLENGCTISFRLQSNADLDSALNLLNRLRPILNQVGPDVIGAPLRGLINSIEENLRDFREQIIVEEQFPEFAITVAGGPNLPGGGGAGGPPRGGGVGAGGPNGGRGAGGPPGGGGVGAGGPNGGRGAAVPNIPRGGGGPGVQNIPRGGGGGAVQNKPGGGGGPGGPDVVAAEVNPGTSTRRTTRQNQRRSTHNYDSTGDFSIEKSGNTSEECQRSSRTPSRTNKRNKPY